MDYTNRDQIASFIEAIRNKLVNKECFSTEDIENWQKVTDFLTNNTESADLEAVESIDTDEQWPSNELPDEIILPTYTQSNKEDESYNEPVETGEIDLKSTEEENVDLLDEDTEYPIEHSQQDSVSSTESDSTNWGDLLEEDDDVLEEALSGINPIEGSNTIDLSDESMIENEEEKLKSPLLSNMDESDDNEEEPMIQNISYNLPNGMVGKTYAVNIEDSDLADLNFSGFVGLEEIGLVYDRDNNTITGTPVEVGDMELEILLIEEDPYENHTIRLFINPDPRSLWKSIDPPEDGKFYKSNVDSGSITNPDFKMLAGSTRGRSHAHEGKYRDDDFDIRSFDNGWQFLAVADGAGSATYSREGSRIVVSTAAEILHTLTNEHGEELDQLLLEISDTEIKDESPLKVLLFSIAKKVVENCRSALNEASEINECKLSDFNTTLIFTIMKPVASGYFVASYAIGDGAAVIYSQGKDIISLMDGDGGEYAGQTRFITMAEVASPEDIFDRVRCCVVEDFTAMLLMTDGVSDPKFQSDADLNNIEVWDGVYSDIESEVDLYGEQADENLTDWLDFFSRGNHDDRTLAMLYKNKTI